MNPKSFKQARSDSFDILGSSFTSQAGLNRDDMKNTQPFETENVLASVLAEY